MASNKKKKTVGSFKILSLLFPAALSVVATATIAATLTIILGRLSYGTDDPMLYAPLIGKASLYSCLHSHAHISRHPIDRRRFIGTEYCFNVARDSLLSSGRRFMLFEISQEKKA